MAWPPSCYGADRVAGHWHCPVIFETMPNEIQMLGVVDRLFPQIMTGEKTSTIRWRERHIVPGPMKFVCDGEPGKTVVVSVTRCTEMPLCQAAAFVGKSDEWPGNIMLAGMRAHYPDIELSSIVQVIEFEPPLSN